MTEDRCEEMRLLVQADVDGELQPADAARVAAHLEHCRTCAGTQAQLLALSAHVRRDAPRYQASDALHAAVRASIAAATPALRPERRLRATAVRSASFGAGFALAACLALFVLLPRDLLPGDGGVPDAVVAAHIRALQPGHLMDVVSTDQHTVKPWFDGRLPFAPPVKDFAAAGFPLAGGRLDYLAGRMAAALVYRRGQHVIDLFAWPGTEPPDGSPASGGRGGYNFLRWRQGGMTFWAVSDLNAQELADFARIWQAP
jgi:anti-sigma factor RsiW